MPVCGVDDRVRLRHPRSRAHEIARTDQAFELRLGRRREQFHAQVLGQLPTFVGDVVVDDDDVDTAVPEGPHRRRSRNGESVDQRRHGVPPATFVKSAMKMPSATATQIAEINQKRMITVVSGQPTNSKW